MRLTQDFGNITLILFFTGGGMKMRLSLIKLLLCFSLGSLGAYAALINDTWQGPDQPDNPVNGDNNNGPSNFLGTPCLFSDPNCVKSGSSTDGTPYAIQSVQLTQQSA